jgi:hypothetical protein
MVPLIAFVAMSAKQPAYLVYNRLILGSLSNHYWRRHETVEPSNKRIRFTRVGIGQILGSMTAKGLMKGEPNGAGYIGVGEDYAKGNGVLFGGRVSVPRRVQTLSNKNSTYQPVVNAFLEKNGIMVPGRITRIVRADLDGNGTQEVIIQASSRDDVTDGGMSGMKPNDYSLVLLRYEDKGKAGEIPLMFDHPSAESLNYMNKLQAIADFDGDGTMEVVVSSAYYEGESATLFRFRGTKLIKLVEMGDGV